MSDPSGPLNLLSLDGGGIRGVCEVLVLQKIMYRVQRRLKLPDEPKPYDYFHLIGGTSTGGLIALMLGRFGMTATQCLEEYNSLARTVFEKPKKTKLGFPSQGGMFSASKLEEVVQGLAARKANEENARMLAEEGSCRCFVTALAFSNVQKPILLRSYRSDDEIPIDCTIWEAARATTAAPTFFKPIDIKRQGGHTTKFMDAGMRINNPLELVLKEAQLCYGSERKVQCVVSLGTGHPGVVGIDKQSVYAISLVQVLMKIATDCISVDESYAGRFQGHDKFYFRFNLEHGAENISLKDWKEIDTLSDHLDAYLGQEGINNRLNAIVDVLCNPPDPASLPTLGAINLVVIAPSIKVEPYETHAPGPCLGYLKRNIYIKLQNFLQSRRDASRHTGTQWILLYGLPGSGKSQLCRQLFEDSCRSITARFWVDASSKDTIIQDYYNIARIAGLNSDDSLQAVRSWLGRISKTGVPWLLILDNFDPSLCVEDFLPRTATDSGCVVVTSIRKFRGSTNDDEYGPLEVGPLSTADASHLLLRVANKRDANSEEQALCHRLVARMGCLPLAVAVAGAHIAAHKYPLAEYIERWEFVFERSPSDTGKLGRNIMATIQIAYEHLESIDKSGDTVKLLHFFAFLHAENASIVPLRMAWKSAQMVPNNKQTHLNILPLSFLNLGEPNCGRKQDFRFDENLREALSTLSSLSLLQFDDLEKIQLHSLIHHWIIYRLKSNERRRWWSLTAQNLALSLSQSAPIEYRRSLLPHLNHLLDFEEEDHADLIFGIHESRSMEDFEAAFRFADVYADLGYFERAFKLRRGIWERIEPRVSKDSYQPRCVEEIADLQLRVKALSMLAASCNDRGEIHKALEYQQSATKMMEDVANFDILSPEVYINAKFEEAQYLRQIGEQTRALKILAEIRLALDRSPQNTSEFRLRMLRTSREIELSKLYRAIDPEALERLQVVITEHTALVAEDDHELLTARSELASCYSKAGCEKQALSEREHIFKIRNRESEFHYDTLVAKDDLAKSYSRVGRKDDAITMRESIIEALEKHATHIEIFYPMSLAVRFNYARSLFDVGDVQGALSVHREVLALRQKREQLGDFSWDILQSMEEVALSLFQLALDDYSNRAVHLEEALDLRHAIREIISELMNSKSPETYRIHRNAQRDTAVFYAELCEFDYNTLNGLNLPEEVEPSPMGLLHYAANLLRTTLSFQQQNFGEEDPDTIATLSELGCVLFRMAKCDHSSQKTQHYQAALECFLQIDRYAPEGVDYSIKNMNDLINTYNKLRRLKDATATLRRLLSLQGELLGVDAVETRTTANKFRAELRSRKDDDAAQKEADELERQYGLSSY